MDLFLIGWWGDHKESASSTFWFQPVWGLCAGGQHAVNFSHLQSSSKILFCVSLEGEPGPCPKAALLFPLAVPALSHIPSLPWLASVWTCPLELREGHGGWMKPTSCNQDTGGHRKAFVPKSPTRSCLVSGFLNASESFYKNLQLIQWELVIRNTFPDQMMYFGLAKTFVWVFP